jgi:restriction system protein
MRRCYRLMLGQGSKFAGDCIAGGFIGVDFDIHEDLSDNLFDDWPSFNKMYIPKYQLVRPDRNNVSAGRACGCLWVVSKGIQVGDLVLSPNGDGCFRLGEVSGNYYYDEGQILPHRRNINWFDTTIAKSDMSEALLASCRSSATYVEITRHIDEIGRFITPSPIQSPPTSTVTSVDEAVAFVMEKHLEDFLVANWNQTLLGKDYTISVEDGSPVGQQYPTDTGPIDILAMSRDKKRLLVVELKRGRASDVVVGQVLRYMGFIKKSVATPDQTVEGAIIALEDDRRIRWALEVTPSVSFYRYQLSFNLAKS